MCINCLFISQLLFGPNRRSFVPKDELERKDYSKIGSFVSFAAQFENEIAVIASFVQSVSHLIQK